VSRFFFLLDFFLKVWYNGNYKIGDCPMTKVTVKRVLSRDQMRKLTVRAYNLRYSSIVTPAEKKEERATHAKAKTPQVKG